MSEFGPIYPILSYFSFINIAQKLDNQTYDMYNESEDQSVKGGKDISADTNIKEGYQYGYLSSYSRIYLLL